jgi:hypothetical protein
MHWATSCPYCTTIFFHHTGILGIWAGLGGKRRWLREERPGFEDLEADDGLRSSTKSGVSELLELDIRCGSAAFQSQDKPSLLSYLKYHYNHDGQLREKAVNTLKSCV